LTEDGGYAVKVLSEQNALRSVANGKNVSPQRPVATVTPPVAKPAEATPESAASADPVRGPEQVAMLH
jgi:hypothetical protein